MTHPNSDFLKFIGTPFEHYILPIIPAGATLAEESSLTAEHLGKIPGSWSSRQHVWYGFPKWQSYYTTRFDLTKWEGWQAPDKVDKAIAIGTRLGVVIAIDIDINNPELADLAEMITVMVLGAPLCVRRREGSARRVLLYLHKPRTMPIEKARVAFTHPLTGDEINAVEVLGLGQQVVIEGPHAKGAMHYWLDGKGPTDLSVQELKAAQQLVGNDIISLTMKLVGWVKDGGGAIHVSSGRKLREKPLVTYEIASPTSPLRVPDKELPTLVKAMQAINLDDPKIDYDAFVKLQRALCASTGCDVGFLADVVWPWVCTQKVTNGAGPRTEERGIEWLEAKWRSFGDSQLGANYVYWVAASEPFNCKEARDALHQDDPDASSLFGAPVTPDNGRCANGDEGVVPGLDGAGAGGASSLPTGGGPLAPRHGEVVLRDTFLSKHGQRFRFIPELGREAGWHQLSTGLWVPAYADISEAVLTMCRAVGDNARRTGGARGAGIDLELQRGSKHTAIRTMLSATPALVTPLRIFDTNPDLLNTPGWVINLREMTGHAHEESDLFRMRTAVSPDWGVGGPPVQWLQALERLSVGRPWLPEVLQIWFGYTLTGYTDWQLILFIPGVIGTGKSIIVRAMEALAGTYAKIKNPEWFVLRRNPDDRFAYDDMTGLRALFGTETIDNSAWNETRLVQVADGENLDVEFKRGAKVKIPSQAKITIAGNHEPRMPAGDRAGGLTRRMMRLYVGKEFVVKEQQIDLLRVLIEQEGPQIMTWLIEGAYKALRMGKSGFLQLAQPLLDAAQEAIGESDPRQQWVTERGILDGDKDKDYIPLKLAYHDYLSFRQTEERGYTERRSAFKNAMVELFDWKWEPVHRGEKDQSKHGALAVYGKKFSGAPDGVDASCVYREKDAAE